MKRDKWGLPDSECVGVHFLWLELSAILICDLSLSCSCRRKRHCWWREKSFFFYFLTQQMSWKASVIISLLMVIMVIIEINLWSIMIVGVFAYSQPWMLSQHHRHDHSHLMFQSSSLLASWLYYSLTFILTLVSHRHVLVSVLVILTYLTTIRL